MAITREQVQRGVKVKIPTRKTVGQSIQNSYEVREARSKGQDFLIITGWDADRVCCAANMQELANGDYFALTDLCLHETPKVFTQDNQPFTLTGKQDDLRNFCEAFNALGFRSPLAKELYEGSHGLLVNLEPGYPPYARKVWGRENLDSTLDVADVGEQLIAAAKEHAAKATKSPPVKQAPATANHYNGREVFDQMLKLFGPDALKNFCTINAFKYRMRAGKKEGNLADADIAKALWYENEAKAL